MTQEPMKAANRPSNVTCRVEADSAQMRTRKEDREDLDHGRWRCQHVYGQRPWTRPDNARREAQPKPLQ